MMQTKYRSVAAARQRGLTLIGLLFWGILVAMLALVVIRVLPTINEFTTIQRAVKKIAQDNPTTVPEVRAAFDRQKNIEGRRQTHGRIVIRERPLITRPGRPFTDA